MEYNEFGTNVINEVESIYEECGWSAYLGDKEKLKRAFENSYYRLGAFDEGVLVGFARCVGDGEYIIYVRDLIVKPSYQRRGIGSRLMKLVSERFSEVRQFLLITDEGDEISNAFYQAIGMEEKINGSHSVKHYFRGIL